MLFVVVVISSSTEVGTLRSSDESLLFDTTETKVYLSPSLAASTSWSEFLSTIGQQQTKFGLGTRYYIADANEKQI